MKFINNIRLFISILFLFNSCISPDSIDFSENEEDRIDHVDIIVPDVLLPDPSEDDLTQTGACGDYSNKVANNKTEIIDPIEIPEDLPENYDLSNMMPPVRSQGSQGSCVAWATTYYLKSYQEKIQHEYEYLSYEDIMSPAFVYNQSKANEDCGSGSAIARALEVLKNKGSNTWKEFPYTDLDCSRSPSEEQLELAE